MNCPPYLTFHLMSCRLCFQGLWLFRCGCTIQVWVWLCRCGCGYAGVWVWLCRCMGVVMQMLIYTCPLSPLPPLSSHSHLLPARHFLAHRKFPPDVLSSTDTMELLSLCSTRMEHMRTPQYDPLRSLLSQLLNHFLTLDPVPPVRGGAGVQPEGGTPIPETTPTPIAVTTPPPLELRKQLLDAYIASIPRNAEDSQLLRGCGYSPRLWEQVSMSLPKKRCELFHESHMCPTCVLHVSYTCPT